MLYYEKDEVLARELYLQTRHELQFLLVNIRFQISAI